MSVFPLAILGALLAGLVLLTVAAPASWLLGGLLLAAEAVVRAALIGLPTGPTWLGIVYVVTCYLDDALIFFAMVRLAQIVGEVEQARADAVGLAVAGERLQAAQELQAAIGERLSGIAAMAAATQRALSRDAVQARAKITAAGAAARDAAMQARQLTARPRGAPGPELAAQARCGAVITVRLAWAVLVMVVLAFATESVAVVIYYGDGARLTALAITDIVLVTALQLYHSWAERASGRPQAWAVTLELRALLAYAAFFPFVHACVGGLAPFLAGSVLLLVPGRWRWAGYAAVAVSWLLLAFSLSLREMTVPAGQRVVNEADFAACIAGTGLVVYGLARLAALARQPEALQGELVGRLIGRDDAQAAAELGQLGRIYTSARADVRLVTGGGQRLSLAAELAAARQILTSRESRSRRTSRTGRCRPWPMTCWPPCCARQSPTSCATALRRRAPSMRGRIMARCGCLSATMGFPSGRLWTAAPAAGWRTSPPESRLLGGA